jgi:hypothetical protein
MPSTISTNYSHNWEDGATSSLGAEGVRILSDMVGDSSTQTGSGAVAAALSKAADSGKETLERKSNVLQDHLKRGATQLFAGDAALNYKDAASQQLINTKREMIYKGTDFRAFMLEFDVAPTSQRDIIEIMGIMKALKYYSHASGSNGSEHVAFPSYFGIEFLKRDGSGANTDLGLKIGKCVLTKMDVNYTPDGLWQTFQSGYPIHLHLSLEFREVELMYRSSIQSGEML